MNKYLYNKKNKLANKIFRKIMAQNLYSLGLLRNGKVYQNKEIAYQAMTQSATNDGVAKLCRYLEPVVGRPNHQDIGWFLCRCSINV
jgi:hypothetical protein